ncbi:hypothetical protein BaRGS_00024632 [Batillaria attramentaria]|uniref:5' exonuclease Apollo n=1 Tax=Batillaria attramentaria TaxID=370345 RepID=A0ABD0KAM5_9CAEN
MNGCVIPGTGIAVDYWKVHTDTKYFFLTHLHGDHVVGLTSTWRYPIYCSSVTAELLAERYGVDRDLLRSLEVGQSHIVPPEQQQQCLPSMTVTVIDANHCPGAVMFLFEGHFGKILYTGDFRYKPCMVDRGSPLASHLGKVDKLYLDNTYCSSKCVFPTREEALEEIVSIVRKHNDYDILLGLRKLGKEELVARLALTLNEWVSVSSERLSVAMYRELPDVFEANQPNLRIRVVPFESVTAKYMQKLNEAKPTIAILPTALFQGIAGRRSAKSPHIFTVPYSDHSSYPELMEFVSKVRPAEVVPIVRAGKVGGVDLSNRTDMSCFSRFLRKTRPRPDQYENTGTVQADSAASPHPADNPLSSSAAHRTRNGPLKRRRSKPWQVQRKRKSCPKGAIYLSDDDGD